jgi:hypothetical protein
MVRVGVTMGGFDPDGEREFCETIAKRAAGRGVRRGTGRG